MYESPLRMLPSRKPMQDRHFFRRYDAAGPDLVNKSSMRRGKSWLLCNNRVPSRAGKPKAGPFVVARQSLIGNVVIEEGARKRILFVDWGWGRERCPSA
jgi:hypothetical protein